MRQNGLSIKFALTALVGLGVALSQSAFAQSYQALDLGTLKNGTYSKANAINSGGQIAGESGVGALDSNSVEIPHAFFWTKEKGMTDLGTFAGGIHSTATGVNAGGMVVGYSDNASGNAHAFLWVKRYGMMDLGVLPGGTTSYATYISANGDIVGYGDDGSGHTHAFRWHVFDPAPNDPAVQPVAVMDDLGALPGGHNSWAQGVNGFGQVVGYADIAGGAKRAFIWDTTNGMQALGLLPGGSKAGAFSINDIGVVAGIADDASGIPHAFSWDSSNGMKDLGTFATLSSDPAMVCINQSGRFAGFLGSKAFLAKNGGLQDLSSFFSGSAPTWTAISGINANLEIAATASAGSSTHAYLLTANVALSGVQCNPTLVTGGTNAQGKVTLTSPAPAGGTQVTLTSDNSAAKIPASVNVPGGATTVSFQIQTTAVKANLTANITASLNGATQQASLQINAPALVGITLYSSSVQGGYTVQGVVTINGPAPKGGMIVVINSDNAAATGPGAVVIPEGMRTASFSVKTKSVLKATAVHLQASMQSLTKSALLNVLPAPKSGR